MKILIVDDNMEDRTILRHYLNQFGGKILEASNGAEGVVIARSERPDLIISDALMPIMDGFEFLREIRRSDELSDIPFIFYSAVYIGCREKELAMSLGADAFMVKPQEPEEFLRQLRNLLEGLDRTKKRGVSDLLGEDEKLKKYSQMVAARLEEKVRELELANSKLAANETRYHNLFNSIRDVIIIVDPASIIIDANQPALREVFGYETEEVLSKFADFLYGSREAFELIGKEYFELQDSRKLKLPEVVYRRKNGELFVGELFAMKLFDEVGKPVGNVGVIRDVTEHRKVEEQLRQSHKMESVGTLANGIAHDFNNILTAIIGYGQLTLAKMSADYPARQNVVYMLEAANRAAHITKELLLFSRKQAIEKKPVDLNMVVAKVERFLKKVIGEDIFLQTTLHENQLLVLADAYQLEQVLMNLSTNARDSMPQGGTLAVTTGITNLTEDLVVTDGFAIPGCYALITVVDTGSGMDEEEQKRIFEPFYTTKEIGKGTGLGLAVVYGIIKRHDGYINVYSEPGQGTTFRIYLPLIRSEV